MTEYEIKDLIQSALAGNTTVLSVVISVISGYLVIAWLVGDKLTKFQVVWINLLFLTFSTMLALRWATGFKTVINLQRDLLQLNVEIGTEVTYEMIMGITFVLAAAILGSLKFMRDVRHPKP